jgi:hypothetical protein
MAAGCGGSSLVLRLQTLNGDTPFSTLERLEAAVIAEDQLLDVASVQVTPANVSGGNLDLAPVPRRDVYVMVTGYDLAGDAAAAGSATPGLGELDRACCLDLCFCTLALVDAGQCTCGSDACAPCP